MATNIKIEILPDGKISVKTGEVSDIHHIDADNLLEELESLLGGAKVTTPNEENPGKVFWKKHQVLRGGKIVKI